MKLLVQRVSTASVTIEGSTFSQISRGLLLYICFEKDDNEQTIAKAIKKIVALRVFEDDKQRMNLSIKDLELEILAVSQFTLSWDGQKGNRPSFEKSLEPNAAREMYEQFCKLLNSELNNNVKQGKFGADMKISSINDGPVTFFLSF